MFTILPVNFLCEDDRLYGVLYLPEKPAKRGILMIQGRPGCCIGPHRLYLELARAWVGRGYPVMRVDYRGSGDSEGPDPVFEETSREIRAALDAYMANVPGLEEVTLWGSCTGAADAIDYAHTDSRVAALGLFNPWAYSARERARARIQYHARLYLRKIRNTAWWKGLFRSEWSVGEHLRELFLTVREAGGGKVGLAYLGGTLETERGRASRMPADTMPFYHAYRTPDMAQRLGDNLQQFRGKQFLLLCGGDVVARSFLSMAKHNPAWMKILSDPRMTLHELPGADHSLRRPEWRAQVIEWSLDWFAQL